MDRISINPEQFREQFQSVLQAAQPMASLSISMGASASSQVLFGLVALLGKLCSCAAEYYSALQSDMRKAEGLLSGLLQEDQHLGEVIENGSVSHQS